MNPLTQLSPSLSSCSPVVLAGFFLPGVAVKRIHYSNHAERLAAKQELIRQTLEEWRQRA